ncbi:MAG TPA: HEPN domain-containing protein [Spirochaetota bacterium]|nr:HEPN domain-containing protein [Spirochaetota bacterium]
MEREKLIEYWLNSSDRDYITMENLFKSTDYHWSLFIGHLVIEKLFKAIYVKNHSDIKNPPRSHDLTLLAYKAKLEISDSQKDDLDRITTFNINARYPDYKMSFYNKCTKEFTEGQIEIIKGVRLWLKELIKK